jgi:sucrose-phosphate synthase
MVDALLVAAGVLLVAFLVWAQIRREKQRTSDICTCTEDGMFPSVRVGGSEPPATDLPSGWISSDEAEYSGVATWLLVTDVDDTLLGDPASYARFVAAVAPAPHIAVVLNSSRPIRSLHKTAEELPTCRAMAWTSSPATVPIPMTMDWRPFGMIGALGTEIELHGQRIGSWQNRFGEFDRRPVDAVMSELGCEPHDPEFQTPLKASFSVPPPLQQKARRLISETAVPARVIRSGDTALDVIPADAGKGAALQQVQALLDIPPERTLAAGDSLNDLDMLQEANAIVVGNATPNLKTALGGGDAYFAKRTHAAGVLEGLQSAGALPPPTLITGAGPTQEDDPLP